MWKSVVEVPAFWSWTRVRLDRNNFQDILASPRFRLISGCWLSYPLLTSQQISHLLQWLSGEGEGGGGGVGNLTYLELCGDLSDVSSPLLSRTVTRDLEVADLIAARLSPAQLSLLLSSQPTSLRLRELRLSQQADLTKEDPARVSLCSLRRPAVRLGRE